MTGYQTPDDLKSIPAFVVLIAAAVRAGGTLGHALLAQRLFEGHRGAG